MHDEILLCASVRLKPDTTYGSVRLKPGTYVRLS